MFSSSAYKENIDKAEKLVQDQAARKRQSRDWNPGLLGHRTARKLVEIASYKP